MTIHMVNKNNRTKMEHILSVGFGNGTLFLNFHVENFMSDELNIYL